MNSEQKREEIRQQYLRELQRYRQQYSSMSQGPRITDNCGGGW